nr:glycosyltransferase [Pseudomonas syringae]
MFSGEYVVSIKRILIIGKAPPIQGGVSVSSYEVALELAGMGYQVDFLSNRQEVLDGYKQIGFEEKECQRLNFIDIEPLLDCFHIPSSSLFFERLAGKALILMQTNNYDLIVGWYLFPYGSVASYISKISRVNFVLLHAGSDINRLARHTCLKAMAAQDLKSASAIITPDDSSVIDRLLELGATRENIKVFNRGMKIIKHNDECVKSFPRFINELRETVVSSIVWFRWDSINEYWGKKIIYPKKVFCTYGKVSESKKIKEIIQAVDNIQLDIEFYLVIILAGEVEELSAIYSVLRYCKAAAMRIIFLPPVSIGILHDLLAVCDAGICIEENFQITNHLSRRPRELMCFSAVPIVSKDFLNLPYYRDILIPNENCMVVDSAKELEVVIPELVKNYDLLSRLKKGVDVTCDYVESKIPRSSPIAQSIAQCLEGNWSE